MSYLFRMSQKPLIVRVFFFLTKENKKDTNYAQLLNKYFYEDPMTFYMFNMNKLYVLNFLIKFVFDVFYSNTLNILFVNFVRKILTSSIKILRVGKQYRLWIYMLKHFKKYDFKCIHFNIQKSMHI